MPGGPFYLQVDYIAPHGDHRQPIGPEPAPRHYDSALNTPLPKPQGLFNEGNVSDKPSFIRDQANYLDPATIRRIKREYQKSLESLRAVDDGIGLIVDALRASGELRNTYIFVLSDNGFFFGEHRLERSKFLPYEPAAHMPLFVRGPGIRPNTVSSELTGNIDLAPTIVELAKARATRGFDGRSLVRFWQDPALRTRRPILLESFAKATDIDGDGDIDFRRERRDVGRRDRPQAGELDPGAGGELPRDPPRPLQVRRVRDRGPRALRPLQGPQGAQQPHRRPALPQASRRACATSSSGSRTAAAASAASSRTSCRPSASRAR